MGSQEQSEPAPAVLTFIVPVLRVRILSYIAVQQSTGGVAAAPAAGVAGGATVPANPGTFGRRTAVFANSEARFCRASGRVVLRKMLEAETWPNVDEGGGGGGMRVATTRQTVCRRAVVAAWPRAGSRSQGSSRAVTSRRQAVSK